MRTLVARSSARIYVSFEYRKWGTRLQKSEQLIARYRRLKAKMVPNFVWRPHCRKSGCFLEDDRCIFDIMLKGDMWSGDSLSMESGR